MSDKTDDKSEPTYPVCSSCGADIICVPETTRPFALMVRHPDGSETMGGYFCLQCLTTMSLLGLAIYPRPTPLARSPAPGGLSHQEIGFLLERMRDILDAAEESLHAGDPAAFEFAGKNGITAHVMNLASTARALIERMR